MQRLIAWLLARYTDYRVVAWAGGKIAGIGFVAPRQRPTIEELEKMLAEPGDAHIIIAPDGSISGVGAMQGRRIPEVRLEAKPWPLDRRARVR